MNSPVTLAVPADRSPMARSVAGSSSRIAARRTAGSPRRGRARAPLAVALAPQGVDRDDDVAGASRSARRGCSGGTARRHRRRCSRRRADRARRRARRLAGRRVVVIVDRGDAGQRRSPPCDSRAPPSRRARRTRAACATRRLQQRLAADVDHAFRPILGQRSPSSACRARRRARRRAIGACARQVAASPPPRARHCRCRRKISCDAGDPALDLDRALVLADAAGWSAASPSSRRADCGWPRSPSRCRRARNSSVGVA